MAVSSLVRINAHPTTSRKVAIYGDLFPEAHKCALDENSPADKNKLTKFLNLPMVINLPLFPARHPQGCF
ncbi:hypothetical protein SAMN06273570_4906 [Candidatus Pantoea floridensis]|uniref:Uncharacterized protein n=1 Tax=Candidatus Pantoea floridensis TaxID=1938870 RepID=A0A286DQT8_9GAMM|nr:hypothetical protein BX596_3988 [Enterobacteriaceae bacterium JKS000233]SOD60914.1 hypothetical protein SAMN06273570_4906 [Pantoea floridensis]